MEGGLESDLSELDLFGFPAYLLGLFSNMSFEHFLFGSPNEYSYIKKYENWKKCRRD